MRCRTRLCSWAGGGRDRARPGRGSLPEGAMVGRDGQYPLGAGDVAASMNLRGLVSISSPTSTDIEIFLLLPDGQLQRRDSHPYVAEARREPFSPHSGRRLVHGWSERWPTPYATPSDRTKLASLKNNCSPNIRRRSTCRGAQALLLALRQVLPTVS